MSVGEQCDQVPSEGCTCEEHQSAVQFCEEEPAEPCATVQSVELANRALGPKDSAQDWAALQPCLDFHCHPRAGKLPFSEPSSTAIECLLRMMKLNYRVCQRLKSVESSYIVIHKKSYHGTLAAVEIIKTLAGVHLNEDLSAREAAVLRLATATLECQTESCLMHHRWVDQGREWRQTSEDFKGINVFRNMFLQSRVHKRIRSRLEAVGLGAVASDKVLCVLVRDLQALSVLLGDKNYLFGNRPSSLDCLCFGLVSNLVYCSVETNLRNIIMTNFSNLFDHCERIKTTYWPDWTRISQKNRNCATPRYFFSFRKPRFKSTQPSSDGPHTYNNCEKTHRSLRLSTRSHRVNCAMRTPASDSNSNTRSWHSTESLLKRENHLKKPSLTSLRSTDDRRTRSGRTVGCTCLPENQNSKITREL